MQATHWLIAAGLGFLFGGCASTQTDTHGGDAAALAPTGKLRVAFLSLRRSIRPRIPPPVSSKGLQLIWEGSLLRVGVPFEPVGYAAVPAMIGGAKAGEWDVALMGINAERATAMDFSAPYMEVEQGYLVRAGVPIATALDVDKSGIRIGVLEKAGADIYLSRTLKNAVLVRATSAADLYALFGAGKADAIAATKTALFAEARSSRAREFLTAGSSPNRLAWACPRGATPLPLRTSASSSKRRKQRGWSSPRSSGPGCAA